MYLKSLSQTGTGRSSVAAADDFQCPFSIGIAAVVTGTATFNIEYSMDDPTASGYSAASATWFIASGFSGATATTGGVLNTPCKAISINITSGTGTVSVKLVQAGPV